MSRILFSTALRGGMASFSAQGVKLFCQVASIAVLSRLVPPDDFGLLSLLWSSFALFDLLRDFGISNAIIQRETVSQSELKKLFQISIFLGLGLLGAVVVVGLSIALIFNELRVITLLPFFGGMFAFQALNAIPLALVRRRLEFGKLAKRDMMAAILGASAGIGAAIAGAGYYSLAIMSLITSFINLVLTWQAAKWIPSGESASFQEVRSYLVFGGSFTAGEFANYISNNLDSLLIGKIWGLHQLGYYSRSYTLMAAPIGQLLNPVISVLMPTMSRVKDNKLEYASWCRNLAYAAAWFSAPIAAFIAAASPEIVLLLLGPGWEESANILGWLALIVYAKPMGSLVYLIMLTSGEVGLMFKWVWMNALLSVIAILIGLVIGPVGVAMALGLAGAFVGVPIAIYYVGKLKTSRYSDFVVPYFQGVIIGGVSYVLLMGSKLFILTNKHQLILHLPLLAVVMLSILGVTGLVFRMRLASVSGSSNYSP